MNAVDCCEAKDVELHEAIDGVSKWTLRVEAKLQGKLDCAWSDVHVVL